MKLENRKWIAQHRPFGSKLQSSFNIIFLIKNTIFKVIFQIKLGSFMRQIYSIKCL